MRTIYTTILVIGLGALPALADTHLGGGDPAAGEKAFKSCRACHSIIADDGTKIFRGGRVGPNLYGVIGREAGAMSDYDYSDSLEAAGEAGLVWDQESFTAFIADPKGYLAEFLDDKSARSKMSFKKDSDAEDLYAYLVSVGPDPEEVSDKEEGESAN